MAIYLKNASYIDWQTLEVSEKNIKVEDGEGGQISFVDTVPADADVIDCEGKYVTKSFGCGHHHIYSTLARGMPAPKKIPENFNEILTYVWWHLDKCLDKDMIEASALASAVYCAKNGVTFVVDHHASPFAVEGSLSTIKDAFDRVGISGLLCYELSDRDGQESREKGLAEHERFLSSGGQGHIGLHASFTVRNELLKSSVDMANKFNTGLHIHVAEAMSDQQACINEHGKRVVKRLYDAGGLEPEQTILAHCVHLDDEERDILRKTDTWVVENVESNQNNNVGLGNYSLIHDKIMLGTDGMHSDMIRSGKAAFLCGQAVEGLGYDKAYERFRNIHKFIKEGGFKGDSDNNLVILDYNSPTELNSDNFLGHYIFGLESRHVDTVISDGRVIVENGQMKNVDEKEIMKFAVEQGKRLWEKMR